MCALSMVHICWLSYTLRKYFMDFSCRLHLCKSHEHPSGSQLVVRILELVALLGDLSYDFLVLCIGVRLVGMRRLRWPLGDIG